MFSVDVCYQRNSGRIQQKGAIAFIRFRHHKVALAKLGIGSPCIQTTTNDHGGIKAALCHHRTHHGGGGRLAVSSCNQNGVLEPHEFGQHLGPTNNWYVIVHVGRSHLRVVSINGRGNHHRVSTGYLLGLMAVGDCRP